MRLTALLAALFLTLTVLPLGTASPGSGALTFDGAPALTGVLSGHGAGEFRLSGEDARLTAQGEEITVRRVYFERSYIETPTGQPIEVDVSDPSEETWQRATGTIDVAPGTGFLGLVTTDTGGTITVPETAVTENALHWLHWPRLITTDTGDTNNGLKVYTYQAERARLHIDALPAAQADGAFTFFVQQATMTFTGPDGEETWVADEYRVGEGPGRYREGVAYYVITIQQGTIEGKANAFDVWLHEPRLTLMGRIEADKASGAIRVDDEEYRFNDRDVRVGGRLELQGAPAGEVVPETAADRRTHVGNAYQGSGRYTGSTLTVGGDVTHVAVAGRVATFLSDDGAMVAAAVGAAAVAAAGAAVLLSPGLKWSLFGSLVPLYAKTQRDRLLDNVSRDRIFQAIRANPGLNLSRIHRIAELGWGVTVYHLKMLEKGGLVFSENGARDRCFFENVPENRRRAKAVAVLANKDSLQRVAKAVAEEPHRSQSDVVSVTGMSQRAVSYSLKRLVQEGLVDAHRDGVFVRYAPQDDLVAALEVVVEEGAAGPAHLSTAGPVSTHVTA